MTRLSFPIALLLLIDSDSKVRWEYKNGIRTDCNQDRSSGRLIL